MQIGLVADTEWLRGTLELSKHGEIAVDAKGATSVPGVCAKAALSAFDHLMRMPAAA